MTTFRTTLRQCLTLLVTLGITGFAACSDSGSAGGSATAADQPFNMHLRSHTETEPNSGRFHVLTKTEKWNPSRTAIVVCDMWDLHHCLNATRRGGELAPRMNQILKTARDRGVTIIHAPSSCMPAYKGHPARSRALAVPKSKNLPKDIGTWCYKIPAEEKGKYPIDQTDGGEDDDLAEHAAWAKKLTAMGRNPRAPWKSQTDLLDIEKTDYISDNGEEIWSIMEQRGIDNVILLGVHTNMCVLGRPFGLRQMSKNGKNVVLMRDITDTMYNPLRAPYVSHLTGTDLIVEHIEKFVCPTVTSVDILGGKPFGFKKDKRKHLVIVMAEREYKTWQTLPTFARKHLGDDFTVSYVFANAKERNVLPGIEVLDTADVALFSIRRRALPEKQMAVIRRYLKAGKPLLGVRTTSHAFSLSFKGDKRPDKGYADWLTWDADIIGGNYTGHHGTEGKGGRGLKVTVTLAEGAAKHPILTGVDPAKLIGNGSLYQTNPLTKTTTPLLIGSIPDNPSEPVAWTNKTEYGGKVFYTALAHIDDFQQPAFNRLMVNAVYWAAGLPVPKKLPVKPKVVATTKK